MRWVGAVLTLVFAVALATAVLDAQRRGGDPKLAARKNPVPSNAASITAGRALYGKNCRHCHGTGGKGDGTLAPKNPSPANLTDDKWDHGNSDGEIFAVIWNGAEPANGKASEMKPMKGTLSEKDVWQIINYLRSIGPASAQAPKPPAKAARK